MFTKKAFLIMAFSAIISGCVSTHPAINQPETIPARVDQDLRALEQAKRFARKNEQPTASRSREVVKIPRGNDWLRNQSIDWTYTNSTLKEALTEILGRRPIKFRLLKDYKNQIKDMPQLPGQQLPLPSGETFTLDSTESGQSERDKYMDMLVSSPSNAPTILQHLDSISTQVGLTYTIENGVVIFTDYELKTFSLGVSAATPSLKSIFNNDGTASSRVEGSVADPDKGQVIFAQFNSAFTKLLPDPNIYFTDVVTNTITIAARPDVMRRAEAYIEGINKVGEKQVRLRVDVYDVNLTALGQRSVDFAIENLASEIQAFSGVTTSISNIGRTIDGSRSQIRFGVDRPGETLDGAQGLIQYLRSQGSLTTRTSTEFELANNETQKQVRTKVTPYVSKVSLTTNTVGIGAATSTAPTVETKNANTGYAIQVSASIVNDLVFLNLLIEESRLVEQTTFEFGNPDGNDGFVSGKLPVTEQQSSTHRLRLMDGETSAIAAQQYSLRNVSTENGSLVPILGDSVDKNEQRIQTLVVVTANIF